MRIEQIDEAVVVEVRGEHRLAEAADVHRGDARILGEVAGAVVDVQDGDGAGIVGTRVDVGVDVGVTVTVEVGEDGDAVDAAGGEEPREPQVLQRLGDEAAEAIAAGADHVETTVSVDVPERRCDVWRADGGLREDRRRRDRPSIPDPGSVDAQHSVVRRQSRRLAERHDTCRGGGGLHEARDRAPAQE